MSLQLKKKSYNQYFDDFSYQIDKKKRIFRIICRVLDIENVDIFVINQRSLIDISNVGYDSPISNFTDTFNPKILITHNIPFCISYIYLSRWHL